MTTKIKIFLIICLVVSTEGFRVTAMSAPNPKTLFVSGMIDQTDNKEWNNLLIAHGMTNLVEEELFGTGLFIPLEKKSEIQDQIKQLVEYTWHSSKGGNGHESVHSTEKSIKSDVCVSGVVKKFRKKRKKAFAGPFSKAKVTISFVIELFLKENGQIICSGLGKGKGVTSSTAVFFQIREDKIQFDKTTVGKAAHKAIKEAVENMVKKYENIR